LKDPDCSAIREDFLPGETVKCSACNQAIVVQRDCVQSANKTLCESCYRALIYPHRQPAME